MTPPRDGHRAADLNDRSRPPLDSRMRRQEPSLPNPVLLAASQSPRGKRLVSSVSARRRVVDRWPDACGRAPMTQLRRAAEHQVAELGLVRR